MTRGLGLQCPAPHSGSLMNWPMGKEGSLKHQEDGFRELGWEACGGAESGMAGEGMEDLHPCPMPCPMHLFCLAVPELYPFKINQYPVSKMFF